jgi:hypothetical protein
MPVDEEEENKRFVAVCQNLRDLAAADALFHPAFVNHYAPGGRPLPTTTRPAEAFQRYYAQFLAALPDATTQIEEQVAERNLVVTHKTFCGTHLGEQWGLPRQAIGCRSSSSTSFASAMANWRSIDATSTGRSCNPRCGRLLRRRLSRRQGQLAGSAPRCPPRPVLA